MTQPNRHQWVAAHILPHEAEVRAWLRRHVHRLSPADIDDLLQEAYARLWSRDLAAIVNGRSYLFTVVRNLLGEHARRARIVPPERLSNDPRSFHIDSNPAEHESRFVALVTSREPTPNLWADAWLAALAISLDYEVTTFDRGFKSFRGLKLRLLEVR